MIKYQDELQDWGEFLVLSQPFDKSLIPKMEVTMINSKFDKIFVNDLFIALSLLRNRLGKNG